MRTGTINALTILVLLFTLAISPAAAEDNEVPEGREVIAVVNGDRIFLDELNKAVATRHQNLEEDTPTAWVGYSGVLDRLINTKLIMQEARDVGLDERSDIREKVQRYRNQILIKLIKGKQLLEIEADEDDIQRIYRDEVRNWKYRTIVFEDLEKARAFRDGLDKEEDFDTEGERYVQEGLAAWDGGEREAKEANLNPEIASAFTGKEIGSVTPVISAVNRFFVFKLTGVNYPENPTSRQRATMRALNLKRDKVLREYTDRLMGKYVTVNQDVLSTVGMGDFTDIEKDTRVLAEIAGEDPVIVADLVSHLKGKFYHGDKTSEYTKSLKFGSEPVLKEVLDERILLKEARETQIDRTDRYQKLVADYEDSLIFGVYLEEFLVPLAQVPEEDIRAAYEARSEEFLLPRKVRADSLAFKGENSALKALESLKRGADLKWLSENAQGLAVKGVTQEEFVLEVAPEELRAVLQNAEAGDMTIHKQEEDLFTVLLVREAPPRQVKPFEQVRSLIARRLFGERLNKAVEDLAAELRAISEITIYEEKLSKGPIRQDRDGQ